MSNDINRMIHPGEVVEAAKRKEKENVRFRSFLKRVAESSELDKQFLALHKEILPKYNCAKCRNCCKLMHAEIPEEDIERDATYLGMTQEELIFVHLKQADGEWLEIHQPVASWVRMGIAGLVKTDRKAARNSPIRISRSDCSACSAF